MNDAITIAVIIPCFGVANQIRRTLAGIGSEVKKIYVVDDCCPERTGQLVQRELCDPRIKVIFNPSNLGVGGAVIAGYKCALADGATILVKLDGDGQMDASRIPDLVTPILAGKADYCKGNRFSCSEDLLAMPRLRIFGNAILSFINKASTGYWDIMDPTNGFTAVHAKVLRQIQLSKVDKGFFFESDLLFRLNLCRAVVRDVSIAASYQGEASNLKIPKVILEFPLKHLRCLVKRIIYRYFVHDFNICSLEITLGSLLLFFGVVFGGYQWYLSTSSGLVASSGTVMFSALPVILGFQLLIGALHFDVSNIPKEVQHLKQN